MMLILFFALFIFAAITTVEDYEILTLLAVGMVLLYLAFFVMGGAHG